MQKIAGIIVAAGASTRMEGKIKQLLPWKKTTLIEHAFSELKSSNISKVFVVLGANYDTILPKIQIPKECIIYNETWRLGIGNSIAKGVEHIISKEEEFDAVLISLADQPLITSDFYNTMLLKFNGSKTSLVATNYGTKIGVPAIFDKSHFSSLEKLNKDFGASEIIKKSNVESIDGQHVVADMDTWEEYLSLINCNK